VFHSIYIDLTVVCFHLLQTGARGGLPHPGQAGGGMQEDGRGESLLL